MNKEIKELWLAALRSGEYEQGRGTLHPTKNSFCCLGVLCDVLSKKDSVAYGQWQETECPIGPFLFKSAKDTGYGFLPDDIRYEVGIPHDRHTELMSKNDNGDSFKKIANFIEKNL